MLSTLSLVVVSPYCMIENRFPWVHLHLQHETCAWFGIHARFDQNFPRKPYKPHYIFSDTKALLMFCFARLALVGCLSIRCLWCVCCVNWNLGLNRLSTAGPTADHKLTNSLTSTFTLTDFSASNRQPPWGTYLVESSIHRHCFSERTR